ncbi:hypothetical protein BDK51DRAFT_34557 [Blyttiomyces helicus]|uniref:Glycosyltransferase 2-like domain-containing protein n=1 Tax=Blyttiomyces helicus TaxID=388810 RepID=A0A4P9WMA8_9FUNG|nr:hypothetical protein BDK51DRAFT_34557 [Blyttiomyces helicus]|eukprot:RKO93153.1 hypothetical protein BDK51DRAFT_34557 [Blyttiomyces helicus]
MPQSTCSLWRSLRTLVILCLLTRFVNRKPRPTYHPPTRRSIAWRCLAPLAILGFFALSLSSLHPTFLHTYPPDSRRAIVSLSTTADRFGPDLDLAIQSLLLQTVPAAEIRVHMPIGDRPLVMRPGSHPPVAVASDVSVPIDAAYPATMAWEDSAGFLPSVPPALRASPVKIVFVEDRGPATKFLYTIHDLLSGPKGADPDTREQPIIVVDDDIYYPPTMLETLLRAGRRNPVAAIANRGWRVAADLVWNSGSDDLVWSVALAREYRVGVITANSGYLIRPGFFVARDSVGGETVPILAAPANVGIASAFLVDDIWISGSLAARGVPRYIVPAPCGDLDISRVHTLEDRMARRGTDRATANTETLKWFKDAWLGDDVWYNRRLDAADRAAFASGLTRVAREVRRWVMWLSIVRS